MPRKENVELTEYRVLYIKGKYQYKKQYNSINGKHHIVYAGPATTMKPIWDVIPKLLRTTSRISTESRRELKKLQDLSLNQENQFEPKGITHIIVYECLQR